MAESKIMIDPGTTLNSLVYMHPMMQLGRLPMLIES